VTGIDILTAAFTISCMLFDLIIFGYHLLATEDMKTTNTTPGVRKTASKNSIPRQVYGRLPRRQQYRVRHKDYEHHSRRKEDYLDEPNATQGVTIPHQV